ncbi:c-type cytochrome [Tropicimonas sp. S265A]|uniref:c-type cytochrome n=1 Tax=Tropicimonas sp. S265A TaxID=3415134 RepID=UPI003C7C8B3A
MKPIALTAMILALASPVLAQEPDPGRETYTTYCAACHGLEAQGDGAMSEIISMPIPDLTQLSANNDGMFPMLEVIHIIDGRTGLRGHGGPMPVYGALFDQEAANPGPYGAPLYTRGKILSLVYYLEAMQN